jgi:hypothetical protein
MPGVQLTEHRGASNFLDQRHFRLRGHLWQPDYVYSEPSAPTT